MDNITQYNQIFMKVFNVPETDLNSEFVASSVSNWDSISHLGLVTAIEDGFDVMFDTDDILDFLSYEKGKQILAKYDVDI